MFRGSGPSREGPDPRNTSDEQVAKDAVCDHFREDTGQRPSVDRKNPDVGINLRVERNHCVVSIDTSGQRCPLVSMLTTQ